MVCWAGAWMCAWGSLAGDEASRSRESCRCCCASNCSRLWMLRRCRGPEPRGEGGGRAIWGWEWAGRLVRGEGWVWAVEGRAPRVMGREGTSMGVGEGERAGRMRMRHIVGGGGPVVLEEGLDGWDSGRVGCGFGGLGC